MSFFCPKKIFTTTLIASEVVPSCHSTHDTLFTTQKNFLQGKKSLLISNQSKQVDALIYLFYPLFYQSLWVELIFLSAFVAGKHASQYLVKNISHFIFLVEIHKHVYLSLFYFVTHFKLGRVETTFVSTD